MWNNERGAQTFPLSERENTITRVGCSQCRVTADLGDLHRVSIVYRTQSNYTWCCSWFTAREAEYHPLSLTIEEPKQEQDQNETGGVNSTIWLSIGLCVPVLASSSRLLSESRVGPCVCNVQPAYHPTRMEALSCLERSKPFRG